MKSESELLHSLITDPGSVSCWLCLERTEDKELQFSKGLLDKLKYILHKDFEVRLSGIPLAICEPCCNDLIRIHNLITKWNTALNTLINVHLNKNSHDKKVLECKIEKNWDETLIEIKVELSENEENQVEDSCINSLTDDDDKINNKNKLETSEDVSKKNIGTSCHLCGKRLKSNNSLVSHVKNMHGEARYKKVGKVSGFGAERRYHCMFCDHKAKNTRALNIHIRTHTGEKPFECVVCNRFFSSYAGLYQHKSVHTNVMNYTCSHCGKQFNTKRKHERHQIVHSHEKKYICDICNKALKNKKTLELHLQRHNNIKNFSCETCGATFVSSSELIGHSKIHKSVKKFECNICKFCTSVKAHLEVHLRRHSGLRPHQCTVCPVKCYTKSILKVHMRTHTKEKNYPCSICEKAFTYSSTLNKHVFRCHGVEYKWCDTVDRRIVK